SCTRPNRSRSSSGPARRRRWTIISPSAPAAGWPIARTAAFRPAAPFTADSARRVAPSPGVCYGRPLMADNLTLSRDGAIATVTLARPDRRNSLSDAMLRDLGAVLTELRDDGATRVVIVTGAPPVFSAGADAPIRREMSDAERRQAFLARPNQFRRLFERATSLLEN